MRFSCLLAVGEQPAQNLSIFDPVSPPADSIRTLAFFTLAITGIIFVIVEGVLIYSIVRFRHGRPASPSEPPQVYGSMPIEVAWIAAPALIVFVLTLVITRTLWEVNVNPDRPPAESKPLRVTVIGHQWWWEYVYDSNDGEELGFITANELHVPQSDFTRPSTRRPVYLTLKSADVCHSFWVPRLAGKTDLIPGRVNNTWFETDHKELFLGQCAEFCGTQHAEMLLRVQVDPVDDSPEGFAAWIENQKKDAVDDPAAREGKALFLSQSCVNCHRVRGTSAAGSYAPDLTHLMSRQTIAAGMEPNTRENLRKWVADPQMMKSGCLMPAFGLSDHEVDLIVDYLFTLK
jgi:cytochrome c oxidase subunit II